LKRSKTSLCTQPQLAPRVCCLGLATDRNESSWPMELPNTRSATARDISNYSIKDRSTALDGKSDRVLPRRATTAGPASRCWCWWCLKSRHRAVLSPAQAQQWLSRPMHGHLPAEPEKDLGCVLQILFCFYLLAGRWVQNREG
jgi:hypothetical protein